MKFSFGLFIAIWLSCFGANLSAQTLSDILKTHEKIIAKSSRKTIGPAIDSLVKSGLPSVEFMLTNWCEKAIWQNKETKEFIAVQDGRMFDLDTAEDIGLFEKTGFKQVKPNSGVRNLISGALVSFQLNAPDIDVRRAALNSIRRNDDAAYLPLLKASLELETDSDLQTEKQQLLSLMTIKYSTQIPEKLAAIEAISQSLKIEVRAQLNRVLSTERRFAKTVPPEANIAQVLTPGTHEFSNEDAYDLLVAGGITQSAPSPSDIKDALAANIIAGQIATVPISQLSDPRRRQIAYQALVAEGLAPRILSASQRNDIISGYIFFEEYAEPSKDVTEAAKAALQRISYRVSFFQFFDIGLDAISLASIYFLAAIGLAITFGVMGVINMAHGEFIMMGAYTGFVVQQFVPDQTLSILLAVPLAFGVTFCAGVAMERLVIRWLYNRPLETLLATFGISIALQQIAKNIFGTQARPLTSPDWLGGAWVINDVVAISYIRIAIFVLALIFLGVFLFILKRTRFGLETRAVTQNQSMASAMGINPDRVNMLTFGLGSGIAGIAGVAIGLYAKVTSEMGNDYIVQSFMTVVVGGVGNIWGTLAGATLVGFLQKGIEWYNPSNTLAAQTYMILFIIIFIQFRPRGIIALKGRAAGD
ncbi:urea ABC transporter permease subunit UrtB [Rhodobacteraceae bacterium nBUS_22]